MSIRLTGAALWASSALLLHSPAIAQSAITDPAVSSTEQQQEEIVVTGKYSAASAVTGTKTDTPLIEVPQSIAVVSATLIDERRPFSLTEALYNVSGVADVGSRRGFDNIVIRGFDANASIYLDGLRVERGSAFVQQEPLGLERIEVLKGPGSVLFGQGSLGGIINQISKRPTDTPLFSTEIMGGSFGTYQGLIDIGGPVTNDGALSGRINAIYRNLEDSIDFIERRRLYVAPSLRWKSGGTTLTVLGAIIRDRRDGNYAGIPPEGVFLPNPNGKVPRNRNIGEPGFDNDRIDRQQIGYQLEHVFDDRWTLRQNGRFTHTDLDSLGIFSGGLDADGRTLQRFIGSVPQDDRAFALDTQVQGRFAWGGLDTTFIAGADLLQQRVDQVFSFGGIGPLDIYQPVYGQQPTPLFPVLDFIRNDSLYGFYLQNQTKIGERLSVLIGGRYDISKTRNFDRLTSQRRRQRDADFTFRVGGVYQVTPGAGFFVSYAEAFNPSFGVSADSEPFEPEQATQYEAGIKTDLAGGRIRTNVSVYRITRDNVLVAFPGVPGLQLQTGQQRSQGFEADAAVRLSDRWNVTAAYTYTDVTVRKDTNPLFVGDRPVSVPSHLVNLWSSYVLPLGPGVLTIGGGGRYVGKREGTLPNSYVIPDYVVADALLDYRLDRWRLRLNAYNLFDANYVDSASPSGTRTVLLGEPLTVRVGVGYGF